MLAAEIGIRYHYFILVTCLHLSSRIDRAFKLLLLRNTDVGVGCLQVPVDEGSKLNALDKKYSRARKIRIEQM